MHINTIPKHAKETWQDLREREQAERVKAVAIAIAHVWRHRKRITLSTSKRIYVSRENHTIEQIYDKTGEWKVEFGSRIFCREHL